MLARLPVLVLALVLVAGCDATEPEPPDAPPADGLVTSLVVTLDPTGYAPLSAVAVLATSEPVSVGVTVPGTGGPETDVTYRLDAASTDQAVPLLGLLPDAANAVALDLYGADGGLLESRAVEVRTGPLVADFPRIDVEAYDASAAAPGLTFVSYFGHAGSTTPQRAFAFDATGAIRWALDLSGHPELSDLFYDNGIDRLANGNLVFGDGSTDAIYEVTLTGEVVGTWPLDGYGFHHMAMEMPSGNFLVTVSKNGLRTVEDHVIEIDRQTGRVVTEWDLRQSLDPGRRAWPTDLADLDVDWFHANALAYDAASDAILVSGRTQGLVKLTRDNRVVWILAPHRDWREDLADKLLRPLDAAGRPITDKDVLDGTAAHPDFEWAWYQHAPEILPGGEIAVFDNGDNRFYQQPGTYSRAVIFDVDEAAGTVRQAWAYGAERGADAYSRIVSDVDVIAETGTVVFAPGAIDRFGDAHGKVIEVERATGRVVFEATVRPPQPLFGITFHRVEKMPLAP